MARKTQKFSIYLGTTDATRESILSSGFFDKIKSGKAKKLEPKQEGDSHFDAYYLVSETKTPNWIKILRNTFKIPNFERSSPASVIVFEEKGRIFAATFGFGAKLLNEYKIEGDYGLKVAINAVSDDALKSVQKSNVAYAIQQFAQSAFKSRFGSFGGQNKFEILKRISGSANEAELDTIVGSAGLSVTTTLQFSEIRKVASKSLDSYNSTKYKNTAFSVIDEFKPVLSKTEREKLDVMLIENILSEHNTFELCLPQINVDDNGYVKVSGTGLRDEFPDISLYLYKESLGDNLSDLTIDDLHQDRIRLYNDEHQPLGNWSVYKCLIGGIEDTDGTRYVLNEGSWYIPAKGVIGPVESYFDQRKAEFDPNLGTFNVEEWKKEIGKKGKIKHIPVYEREEIYNNRISSTTSYVCFDQEWHRSDDGTFSKLEMCDLYDADKLRMLHVKRTSRRPSMLSYLFEQGQRAALLWQRDDVRSQFIERVRAEAGEEFALKLSTADPGAITIEFVIADYENADGNYTIPFLAKLSFESKSRDVELRGFQTRVRFIPLEKPKLM